ncbi:MAG: phosphoribosylamine--glycine ligase [Fusobacteriaceae bacterium]
MKVLVIGKGGREHAIAWKISSSPKVSTVYCAPGNPGTANFCKNIPINDNQINELLNFAKENSIDLTIVGPESTLSLGIVDKFQENGLKIFGPTAAATQIESSKKFAKDLMKKYNIPTASYESFTDLNEALKYLEIQGVPIVIKEDGLKSGKGVTVAFTLREAQEALNKAFTIENNRVVIEEYLEGFEFSLIAMIHNKIVIPLEVAQDHKRVLDNDLGPNTGGMGVYSPVPSITSEIIEQSIKEIIQPTVDAMELEGMPFTGFLFAGIMLTKNGVKTIEFNARLGDPESQVILPRMKSDFLDIILNLLNDQKTEILWDERFALGVVLASTGYPESFTKDSPIEITDLLEETLLFHMGTKFENNQLLTNGGRVLIPVTLGNSLKIAKDLAYSEIKKIKCNKLFFRNDIGNKSLI